MWNGSTIFGVKNVESSKRNGQIYCTTILGQFDDVPNDCVKIGP